MGYCILGVVIALLVLGWGWREWVWRHRAHMAHRVQAYLMREADDQRKARKNKALLAAEAIEARNQRKASEAKACEALWAKIWTKALETRGPGLFNPMQYRDGKFVWQRAIELLMDLRRFRGDFTAEQVRRIGNFVLAVKKAALDQDRIYQACCPTGEMEFDAEGGFRVRS